MSAPAAGKPRARKGTGKSSKSPKRTAAEAEGRSVIEKAPEPEPKVITLRDREYTLPEKLPPSMIFDMVEVEAAEGSQNPIPIFRLVRNVLGAEQFNRLRNDLEGADEKDIGTAVAEAVEAIFGVYGVTPGES